MQKVMLMGYVGTDPEERRTAKGARVTSFRMAVSNRKDEEATWYSVSSFGSDLKGIIAHLKKGSGVTVIGDLAPPKVYQGKNGPGVSLQVYVSSINFLPGKKEEEKKEENQESDKFGELPF